MGKDVLAAVLGFTHFCLLFATAVVGGGSNQPAHHVYWSAGEDELPR